MATTVFTSRWECALRVSSAQFSRSLSRQLSRGQRSCLKQFRWVKWMVLR